MGQERCVYEVAPDWRGVNKDGGKIGERSRRRLGARAEQFFGLASAKTGPAFEIVQQRFANKWATIGTDHALQLIDSSLRAFQLDGQSALLGATEGFYDIPLEALPEGLRENAGGRLKRVAVENRSTGKTRLAVAWSSPRKVLHCHIDQGSVGLPSKLWLFCRQQVRGWFWLDSAHRRHNNAIDSFNDAGLSWVRGEMAFLASVGTGPWATQGHHGTLSDALAEYCENFDWRDPIFASMYSRIIFHRCKGDIPYDFGSEAHLQDLDCRWCQKQ